MALGRTVLSFAHHSVEAMTLLGRVSFDALHLIRNPARMPWREISANIYRTGTQALGITALVGFLVGIVLSYLSAQQLKSFGADIYIVNLLGISIVRELGPVLAAILIAGRSGSAMTAQIGVMRVTEELDALAVMGIPHTTRLVLPKMIALAVTMPLLILWTNAIALIGGMASAQFQLGLDYRHFIRSLPGAVPTANLWLGLGKGVVFGILIALIACHFGLRIKPNTESLGLGTTNSVVTAITVVIVVDAVFAIMFSDIGIFS
jgi:phospholipid/cholesterol/gamma-HCH transport system permease protein